MKNIRGGPSALGLTRAVESCGATRFCETVIDPATEPIP
jgi:hypothetical protein